MARRTWTVTPLRGSLTDGTSPSIPGLSVKVPQDGGNIGVLARLQPHGHVVQLGVATHLHAIGLGVEQGYLLAVATMQETLAIVLVRHRHAQQAGVEALRPRQVAGIDHDVVDTGHFERGLDHGSSSLL